MFNITKSVYINDVNYKILEKIKDGKATSMKYDTKKMRFKTPNVIAPRWGTVLRPGNWWV